MMKFQQDTNFQLNYWPGFVDALSSLLIVLIFTLVIFMVSQLSLSEALRGSTQETNTLQSKLAALAGQLDIATQDNQALSSHFETLKKNAEFEKLSAEEQILSLQGQVGELNSKLSLLVQALELSENIVIEKQLKIDDLDQKLTQALAHKLHQLEKYRSEFFGKLQDLLGDRADVKISGDRFVFQSEVLFPSGSANLSEKGKVAIQKLATTLKEIAATVPDDLPWILRIDGHTDDLKVRPNPSFTSNWELSAARAIAVVNFLMQQGLPAERLAAAGFGEYHPLEKGTSPQVRAKNRRIEVKLDQI